VSLPRHLEPAELVLGLAVILAYTATFLHWDVTVDDAFISFRYAEHLRTTGELVYNSGERVEGISNLLWTLLLALLSGLGLPPTQAALGMGYLAGLGTLLLVERSARGVLGLGWVSAWFGAALCAINPSFSFWAASGLETPLYAGGLLLAWRALESTATPWTAARLGAAGILLGLTRPEGMLMALGLPCVLLIRRVPIRLVLRALWVIGLSLGVLELWRMAYYGALVPNSVLAKSGFSLPGLVRGARYLGDFLVRDRFLWVLPLWILGKPTERSRWSLSLLVLACALFAVLVGGDGLYRYRLLAHGLPLLGLLLAAGLERIGSTRPRLGALLGVMSLAVVAEPLLGREFFAGQPLGAIREWEARFGRVGRALRQAAPAGAWLATNVAGKVPFYSGLPTLDLLGLTDPVIAQSRVQDYGRGYAGHERAAPEYVLTRRPEIVYLSVLDGLPAALLAHPASVARILGAGSLFRYQPLVEDERWRHAYRPALLRLDDGSLAGVFVLRGSSTETQASPALRWLE
jgi:arabinofuranosyltransferase